jgi:plasmid stabilization system protein ParE
MTRLEWTDPAVADLEHIQDYIARDSVEYADALVERLILR